MSEAADLAARARRLLARGVAWIDPAGERYAIRMGPSRRARVALTLDEAAFRRLIERPGLKVRPNGGWVLRPPPSEPPSPPPGRPGFIPGLRPVIEPDGAIVLRSANLGRSAIAWLAGRADADGRPWLGPAETAAAERLASEAEAALRGPSLTQRWDALPRSTFSDRSRAGPEDRALAAGRRVEAALKACGPARAMVEAVCIRATALQAAERDLGLRKRTGKILLRKGLQALASHYGVH